jgi:hypothetical protein
MLDYGFAHPFLSIFLCFIFFPTVYFSICTILDNRTIARLGAFPPTVRAKLPFGIDVSICSTPLSRFSQNPDEVEGIFWDFLLLGHLLTFLFVPERGTLIFQTC